MADSIKKLQDLFSRFPTIGSRTASRFVFYILSLSKEQITELLTAIAEVKNKIKFCNFCFQPFEALVKEGLCPICSDPSRNKQLLCIVEKEADLLSVEKAKRYNGLYFILGGVLSLRRNNVEQLRIAALGERIRNPQKFGIEKVDLNEVIIALNPTPEGKSTSRLVEKSLKDNGLLIKVTHLAQGLPVGGELEYADDETLESAFEGRK